MTDAHPERFPRKLLDSPVFVMLQVMRSARRAAMQRPDGPRLWTTMALAALDEFGPLSQGEIARHIGIDASDIVRVIDRLESDRYARRKPDAADRRRNVVTITPAGSRWLAAQLERMHARESDFLAGLDARERAELHALLLRVLEERLPEQAL